MVVDIKVDGKQFKCLQCKNPTFEYDEETANCTCTKCGRTHYGFVDRVGYKNNVLLTEV